MGKGIAARKYYSSKSCSSIVPLSRDGSRKTASTVYQSEHLVLMGGGDLPLVQI